MVCVKRGITLSTQLDLCSLEHLKSHGSKFEQMLNECFSLFLCRNKRSRPRYFTMSQVLYIHASKIFSRGTIYLIFCLFHYLYSFPTSILALFLHSIVVKTSMSPFKHYPILIQKIFFHGLMSYGIHRVGEGGGFNV